MFGAPTSLGPLRATGVRLLLAALAVLGSGLAEAEPAAPPLAVALLETAEGETTRLFETLVSGLEQGSGIEVMRVVMDTERDTVSLPPRRSTVLKLALNEAGGTIAVIFPDIGEPYRSVFAQIVDGIEDKARNRVVSISVGAGSNPQDIANELRKHEVKVVIALGRHGILATSGLDRDISVVAGAIVGAPENDTRLTSVHSLAPDPNLLFARLKALSPEIKRVHAVFDPRQNAWLMRLAHDAAAANGLELVTYEAADLKTALKTYQDIMNAADTHRDAIWLPQDSTTVDDNAVLPFLLQESWNRTLTLFSSNISHVKRGALFALYPNNLELGRNLAQSALGLIGNSSAGRSMVPLRSVFLAVNVRTASHLGLAVNPRQNRIDMVFPTP